MAHGTTTSISRPTPCTLDSTSTFTDSSRRSCACVFCLVSRGFSENLPGDGQADNDGSATASALPLTRRRCNSAISPACTTSAPTGPTITGSDISFGLSWLKKILPPQSIVCLFC
ncbi:MAG: hypothetical protein Q8P67_02810 [archaeon]|nr:hypothetical protein [archaeon]